MNNAQCTKCTWDESGFSGCTECLPTHFLTSDGECVLDSCATYDHVTGMCLTCNKHVTSTLIP